MARDFYQVITPAAELPITLVEAKDWCRVSTTADDTLIDSLIAAATDMAERYTNLVFIERTFAGSFNGLSYSKYEINMYVELRRSPFKSLTSITDSDLNDLTTDFTIKKGASFTRLVLDESVVLDSVPYPLTVEFVAGYGLAADVPDMIKTAIKQLVCFMYSAKGDCGGGCSVLPQHIAIMLNSYKILNTFA